MNSKQIEEIVTEEFETLEEQFDIIIDTSDINNHYLELTFTKNGESVGYIEIHLSPKSFARIQQIELEPEFRTQGVGKTIVLAIERTLNSLDLTYIDLYADPQAIGFWMKLGYQQIKFSDYFVKYL